MVVLMFVVGMVVGTIITWFSVKPLNSWNEGYEAAKKTYSDWDKGYHVGFEAAEKHFTDYGEGFYDGWKAAKAQPTVSTNTKHISTQDFIRKTMVHGIHTEAEGEE